MLGRLGIEQAHGLYVSMPNLDMTILRRDHGELNSLFAESS
jgi:hypothetical protein